MSQQEFITHAAIIVNGKIYQLAKPSTHKNCIDLAVSLLGKQVTPDTYGFITSSGRFLDREAALSVATTANQIRIKMNPKNRLFTEDMW